MENMTEAHYLSMLLISAGSFIFGILPLAFSYRMTRPFPFFLSLIVCLGAGVLLSTSLVHMLTEVQLELKSSTQLYFCAGFLFLYTIDEIIHYCLGGVKSEVDLAFVECERNRNRMKSDYGATFDSAGFSENSPFLEPSGSKNCEIFPSEKRFEGSHSRSSNEDRLKKDSQQNLLDVYVNSENNDQFHASYPPEEERWSPNFATKTGLFLALLIHSILEGISVGVQTKISRVLLLLGAVTLHKITLSFCLGLELHFYGLKPAHLMVAIFLFSIGSPIGIFLGMIVTSLKYSMFNTAAQLQAVAAGSLLYVAAFEVLPRERFKWKQSNQKAAGVYQLLFVLLGFTCIAVFHFFLDPANDG